MVGEVSRHERPRPAERPARRRRGRRAGRRADRGPPRPAQHLQRPGHAGRRAGRGRGGAPEAARAGREGHQRAVRHHPVRPAGDRGEGGAGRREEAPMTLWWILDLVLLFVVVPVVVILLRDVLNAARGIVPSVEKITAAARAGSRDLDAVPLLLTTQRQVRETVENVAAYGGSPDVIVGDAGWPAPPSCC